MSGSEERVPCDGMTVSQDHRKLLRPPDDRRSPDVREQMSPLLEHKDEKSNPDIASSDSDFSDDADYAGESTGIRILEEKCDMKCIENEIDLGNIEKKTGDKSVKTVLSPHHKALLEAGSSLGSISLPPQRIALHPNHQELIWAGSSLGTMHKLPIQAFLHKDLSVTGSRNSMRSKPSMCRFGSQTVSESGTDMYTFCRICQMTGDEKDPLFTPCRCCGSLRYVHSSCLKKWIRISARRAKKKTPRCELCHYQYNRHKHFKFSQWRWPRVNVRDKFLHILFLLNMLIMVGCAIATVMCFLSDRGRINKDPKAKVKLTTEEIITLTCGVMFFVAFFIAMTVEIKARHTLYKLFLRFITRNTEWTVEQYDRSKDPLYKTPPIYV